MYQLHHFSAEFTLSILVLLGTGCSDGRALPMDGMPSIDGGVQTPDTSAAPDTGAILECGGACTSAETCCGDSCVTDATCAFSLESISVVEGYIGGGGFLTLRGQGFATGMRGDGSVLVRGGAPCGAGAAAYSYLYFLESAPLF